MKILTGKTGTPHVTGQQFRQLVEGTVGQESYILTSGENLEPELSSNNLLKIRSGIMSHHGNLSTVEIGTYDEVTIQNGTQGMKRIDLVVNRYTKNDETGIEENEWVVIMGTPDADSPVAPAYTEGNLQEGDLVDDCPVFEVHLDGINVTEVKKLLSVSPDIPTLNAYLAELSEKKLIQDGLSVCTDVHAAVSGGSPKEVAIFKVGKTINMRLNIHFSASIAQYATIFRLPSELWPKISQLFINNNGNVFLINSGSGAVTAQQSIPSGTWLQISMSYLLA